MLRRVPVSVSCAAASRCAAARSTTLSVAATPYLITQRRHGSGGNLISSFLALCVQSADSALVSLDSTIVATTGLTAAASPLNPILALFAFGFLLRLGTVCALSLYSDRSLDRIAQASPELQKAFLLYAEVAWNPHALRAEVELAGKRYAERSMKIMKKFDTSSLKFNVPNWGNGAICLGAAAAVCWAAPPLGLYHINSYGAVVGLNVVNAAAMALWVRNSDAAFDNQKGFYDKRDQTTEWQRTWLHRVAVAWFCVYAAVSLVFFLGTEKKTEEKTGEQEEETSSSSSKTVFVAPDGAACLPFFLLGLVTAGLLRRPLRTVIKRRGGALVRWPPKRPKLHGSYGEYYWNLGDHWSNMKEAANASGEAKRTAENYLKGKLQLEYECDRRLHKMGGVWANLFKDSRNTLPPDMGERPQDMAFTGPEKKGMPLSEYADKFGDDVPRVSKQQTP